MKLGNAFSDSLIVERFRSRSHTSEKNPGWWIGRGKGLLFLSFTLVAISTLLFRLFHLTVVEGHSMRALADDNRTRELVRHAPRGNLLDRSGKPLTENIPQYRLNAPCMDDRTRLCITRLSEEQKIQAEQKGLPQGSFLDTGYMRRYLRDESTAHVLGYTGELSERESNDEYYQLRKYIPGDKVGRSGAEVVFEEQLRGRNGRELVEVNAQGKTVRTLGVDKEIVGADVTLSLDGRLADIVREAFPSGMRGVVVVMKPQTGEILALYSSPSYSANALSEGLTTKEYEALLGGVDRPMFNRAIGGVYPPGSTFKIITSIAALEEGTVSIDTTIEDTGVIEVGAARYTNWYFTKNGGTDGLVNVIKAIQRSNDTYFYRIGEMLGVEKLAKWARLLGIGKPLGIELSGEASGLMPDPLWKAQQFSSPEDKELRNDMWYTGDNYNLAIGQGYLLTTPLQVASWTSVVANGGYFCKPTIERVGLGGKQAKCTKLTIKPDTIDAVTKGMRRACEADGTGWPLFGFHVPKPGAVVPTKDPTASGSATPKVPMVRVPVACKTGTAETGNPKETTPHAWFTAFAPVVEKYAEIGSTGYKDEEEITGDPEIAVTVLVENGGEGSSVAAPVAKKVLEEWFRR